MNILIRNQNYKITDTLNIDIIKTLTGEFDLEDVQKELINFYYNKVIIDITSIKNHYNISNMLEFLKGFEPNKVIILLNDSQLINSPSYLKALIDNGYYNFTRNAAGINYLIDNPNEYKDVEKYLSAPKEEPQKESISDEILRQRNPNQKIIGIQNLTDHAGATTLTYLMYTHLKKNYSVKAIEMNKQDFIYFKDDNLSFCTSIDDFKLKLKEYSDIEAIIVDLNTFESEELIDEKIFLIEPGIVPLNKLLKSRQNLNEILNEGKTVLNKSSLLGSEVGNLEYETKFKIFYNMPPINDRKEDLPAVNELLTKLGFEKQDPEKTSIFGNIFRK